MSIQGLSLQLRTVDLDRAISFYVDKLGFTVSFRYEDFYAGLETCGHMIHLKLIDSPDPGVDFVREGGHMHLYIVVDDIDSVFESVMQSGVSVTEEITERPWDMKEFVIEDPDGHTIYFSQPL